LCNFVQLSYRFPRTRPILDGEPIIVVQDGKHRERLTIEQIAEEARKQQIAHLADVRFAILENDGTISFVPQSQ
jgi:uncharacterized membrane protein YcaP (DUF421 family)